MPIMKCQYYIRTCLLYHSEDCIVRLKLFSVSEQILSINDKDSYKIILLKTLTII